MPVTQRLNEGQELLRLDRASGTLRSREYRLTVSSGPDLGKSMTFSHLVVVGTHEDVGFVLTDPSVSRQHVELQPKPDGLFVRDLRSTNGTFVGGARIEEALLEKEGTLRLGKTLLHVGIHEQDVALSESTRTSFGKALGQSRKMRHLFAMLERVSTTDTPVVLTGETGTGKDVLAQAIHAHSHRKAAPFVVLDCGAVAPTLVESELFGHAKGAFTGAVKEKRGLFEAADGGTLFLDEIGELPLELQPRLLRALEAGTIRRVGEDHYRSVDVRIIAASHRDLEQDVADGRFRQDLFYRLAVALFRVPALRERLEDLPLLVQSFLREQERPDLALPDEVLTKAMNYPWPGNVRELWNFVARAVIGTDSLSLGSMGGHSPPDAVHEGRSALALDLPYKQAKDHLVEVFTRDYIEGLLAKHGGNISQTAKAAGLARTYIHRLVVRYGLNTSGDS